MNTVTLIKKKRAGEALTAEELKFLVNGYTAGEIPEYQMSALLMAIYFKGMSSIETAELVSLMLHSGSIVDLSKVKLPKVDKHSTGGIGDKTTFLLAPILASCGLAYPTIAGRSLAHTGGTIDKLEAIPGFNCALTLKRFEELVSTVGLAFMGQTEEICPADRKLYALRDVTATVESLPLIVASIMSKKLAEGIDAIVFDVKCGSGAFMRTEKEAVALAKALVATGRAAGKLASALVTDMSEPLGRTVGNAIEVNECVEFLRRGPQDPVPDARLQEITLALAEEMYGLGLKNQGKKNPGKAAVRKMLLGVIESGQAYSKFLEIVSMQGGDTSALDSGLPLARKKLALVASQKGFLNSIDGEKIGWALTELGGGRRKSSDKIDHSVGFSFEKSVGSAVKKGETIALVHAKDSKSANLALAMLAESINITPQPPRKPKLIRKQI
jgi:pyrimidine-nucleoside phosphorylase